MPHVPNGAGTLPPPSSFWIRSLFKCPMTFWSFSFGAALTGNKLLLPHTPSSFQFCLNKIGTITMTLSTFQKQGMEQRSESFPLSHMHHRPSNSTALCWHLSGSQDGNAFNYLPLGSCSTVFAWKEQVKKYGRKLMWLVVVLRMFFLLRTFFVLMSLFSFTVSSEASLPAQKAQIYITQRHQPTPPKTKSYMQLFPVGDARKLTQSHHAGEWWSQNQSQELQTTRPKLRCRLQCCSSSTQPFQTNHYAYRKPHPKPETTICGRRRKEDKLLTNRRQL